MLKNWTSHPDYQQFIISNISIVYKDFPQWVTSMACSISKLYLLNLDILRDILEPTYSHTSRSATFQPEIFRSFSLMLFMQETSLTNWLQKLHSTPFLHLLIGCNKYHLPSLGAHYDFISRLWLSNLNEDRLQLKRTYSFKKKPSKTKAPGKNKKLPNKHSGVVGRVVDFFKKGRSFAYRTERLMQKIFALIAVSPSSSLGLIPKENLTIAGDGTCVHTHASYYGKKLCNCREQAG